LQARCMPGSDCSMSANEVATAHDIHEEVLYSGTAYCMLEA
jgi:hypothetical protein